MDLFNGFNAQIEQKLLHKKRIFVLFGHKDTNKWAKNQIYKGAYFFAGTNVSHV